MMTLGRLSGLVLDTGSDETDLGRWCWIKLGGGGKTTRIVTAYQPCDPGKDTAGETVWDQHQRYFEARGDGRSPRTIFLRTLLHSFFCGKQVVRKLSYLQTSMRMYTLVALQKG